MRDSLSKLLISFVALIVALASPAMAAERLSGSGWSMSLDVPAGKGPFPAVIFLPGCSGNAPPAVAAGLRDHARRLVAAGYAAGTMNALGGRSICANLAALGTKEVSAARAAIAAAGKLALDKRIDGAKIGFIGQSFGGSVALRIASGASPFKAVVAYYPWCRDGTRVRIPALIMTGRADTWTPAARCRGTGAQVVTYAGAVHSFDLKTLKRQSIKGVGGDYPVAGDMAAASASQARYLGFFKRAFGR